MFVSTNILGFYTFKKYHSRVWDLFDIFTFWLLYSKQGVITCDSSLHNQNHKTVIFFNVRTYSYISLFLRSLFFQVVEITEELATLPKRAQLAAAFITYLSAAPESLRKTCLEEWTKSAGLESLYLVTPEFKISIY